MERKCRGVGIFINPESAEAVNSIHKIRSEAESLGEEVFLIAESLNEKPRTSGIEIRSVADELPCWTAIVGGDGTLLKALRYRKIRDSLLITIGAGRRCYYFDLTTEELDGVLKKIKMGMYAEQHLWMMRASGEGFNEDFLNELVLTGGSAKVMELDVSVDGEKVYRIAGDGVIVATASGSTAYSLSAGGPIVDPFLTSAVITPLNPLTLHARPLVVDPHSSIVLEIVRRTGKERAIVDGQAELYPPDVIRVNLLERPLRFARLRRLRFYERVIRGSCGHNI